MAQYHALVSGLPNLSLDTNKAPYTQAELYAELEELLSNKDLALLDWLRLESYNQDFIKLYQSGVLAPQEEQEEEHDEDEETCLPISKLRQASLAASQGEPLLHSKCIPSYILRFLNEAYMPQNEDEDAEQTPKSLLSDQDRLTQLYYASASRHKNKFLATWFGFNQTLRNLLALYTCRHLGWPAENYIVGDREVEEKLLNSKAKDFDLSEECPYIMQMITIANERDIARRERMIDALRWQFLEEQTEWTVFDVENVLAYYLKIGIIERWLNLDEEQGQKVFRDIVMGLKAESQKALSDFREKTKK